MTRIIITETQDFVTVSFQHVLQQPEDAVIKKAKVE